MNIITSVKKLSDSVLLKQTEFLVERERADTLLILRHLREIEIRRLFIDLKYSSMHKYCIKHLKYSEHETQVRLSSARLLIDLPEIETQIQNGDLNLTNLAQAQTFIRTEKSVSIVMDREQKLELLQEIQGKSTREVKKELINKSHQPGLLAEKFKVALDSNNQVVTKFEVQLNEEQQTILKEFRDLYAHELADQSDFHTLMFLLQKATQFKKKKLGLLPKTAKTANASMKGSDCSSHSLFSIASPSEAKTKSDRTETTPLKNNSNALLPCAHNVTPLPQQRKALAVSKKRQVWSKAKGQCEHYDGKTHVRCESKYALEIDHVESLALGGTDDTSNLRLLCKAHNSRRAIQMFGAGKF